MHLNTKHSYTNLHVLPHQVTKLQEKIKNSKKKKIH